MVEDGQRQFVRITGPSADAFTKIRGLTTFSSMAFALVTALTFVGLRDYVFSHATFRLGMIYILFAMAAATIVVTIAQRIQLYREVQNGYVTLINFRNVRKPVARVDSKTGRILCLPNDNFPKPYMRRTEAQAFADQRYKTNIRYLAER